GACGAAIDGPGERGAGRLVPAGERTRLPRAVPAVLRAARRRELPRRLEAATRHVEQLLVARPGRVAGAVRADAGAAGDAVGAAVGRGPGHPDPRAPPRRPRVACAAPARERRVALVAARI